MASVVSILTNTQRRVQFIQNGNTVITLDVSASETHSRESPPTEFEVENGQVVSDHVVLKPFSLHLQGIISDTPLNLQAILAGAATTAVSTFIPQAGVLAAGAGSGVALFSALASSKSPSVAAYNQLLQLQAMKMPFDVLTTLFLYKNMWIKSLSIPRDASTGRVLVFDIDLVQLLLVTPQTVNIVKFAAPDVAASQSDKGKQEASQAAAFFRQGVGDVNAVGAKVGLSG
jgi:hypothetical protein